VDPTQVGDLNLLVNRKEFKPTVKLLMEHLPIRENPQRLGPTGTKAGFSFAAPYRPYRKNPSYSFAEPYRE